MPCVTPCWLGIIWLAVQAAQPPQVPACRLEIALEPASLVLGQVELVRVRIQVGDGAGAPDHAAAPEVLVRLGAVGPLRAVGPGRFEAEYRPPAARFPQLEILVARLPGRALAWVALPLWGAGTVRVETEPGAEVSLEVAGRSFGPIHADARGLAVMPFEAPPGTEQGELILKSGDRRTIDLGVPALEPLWLLAETTRLCLPDQREARLHLFAVDAAGRPWAEAPVLLLAEGADIDSPRETSPGHFEAMLHLAAGAGPGEILVRAGLAAPLAGPVSEARLVVEAPPAPPSIAAPPLAAPVVKAQPVPAPRPWWAQPSTYAWVTLGLGLAASVPGGVLVGLDGQGTCDAPSGVRCPEIYDTLVPGAVLLGTGAALLGTALILVLLGDEPGEDQPGSAASLGFVPGDGGFSLSGTFRF
ncbi:MAG TPA: hypothetical protein PK668_06260 [Myxococcota bacterium]|nr:hypothetical protein [Myxococcota bacterium]HRY92555.1 hypothetical protein [Myxococcota bacterium]